MINKDKHCRISVEGSISVLQYRYHKLRKILYDTDVTISR